MSLLEQIKSWRRFLRPKYFVWLLVFIASLVLVMSWSPATTNPAIKYLPKNTTFYWQWSNNQVFSEPALNKLPVIKAAVPLKQAAKLATILGDVWLQLDEVVWFKVAASDSDYYLLRVNNAKPIVKNLTAKNLAYDFKIVGTNVVLVSPSDNILSLDDQYLEVPENDLDQGINIYWQSTAAPDFLQDLSKWLKLSSENPSVYANLKTAKNGKISFNVWQNKLRRLINASSSYPWPNQALVPYNMDTALGWQSPVELSDQAIISQYLLKDLIPDLPYYNLGEKELEQLVYKNNFIFKNSEGWLLVGQSDWRTAAVNLLPNFKLVEVKKVLADGTAYIEYQAADQQDLQDHSYRDKNYWQVGNLFGYDTDGVYYLSNQASLIEKTIASQTQMIALIGFCNQKFTGQLNDLLLIKTKELSDSQLKVVLSGQGIDSLTVFSYENNLVKGWQACF